MYFQENLKTSEDLAEFFDDPDDWVYVMCYENYNILNAVITHRTEDKLSLNIKRIVIELSDQSIYSVIKILNDELIECECISKRSDGRPMVFQDIKSLFDYFFETHGKAA